MEVIADVDEADIGGVKLGQRVAFTVDAFPTSTFEGFVKEVRQEGIVESNVVTYEVVISAANPDLKLKPGMTASIEIYTLEADCDTVVPAAALAFTPPAVDKEAAAKRAATGGVANGGRVWVKSGDKIEPRRVEVGVSNGIYTEVSGLNLGDSVILSTKSAPRVAGAGSARSPFMPQRPSDHENKESNMKKVVIEMVLHASVRWVTRQFVLCAEFRSRSWRVSL